MRISVWSSDVCSSELGDGRAAGILQCLPRTSEIGAESRGIHRENALVIPAVARDLVARIDDPADQRGVTMRDPAEREEGRLDPRLAEQREHRIGIAFDALRPPIPLGFRDHRFSRAALDPALDTDRQTVQHRRATPPAALPPPTATLPSPHPPSTP